MIDRTHDQHRTNPRTSGCNQTHVFMRLHSQSLCSKLQLKERTSIHPKRITSNSTVSVCAIAILVVVIVLFELHIRNRTSHSLPRRRQFGELKSQIGGGLRTA